MSMFQSTGSDLLQGYAQYNAVLRKQYPALTFAALYLQQIDDALEEAAPLVRELWAWHGAKEFEHRVVAYDVLHAIA